MHNPKAKSDHYWKATLSQEQYNVCRMGATEPPFTGRYYNNKQTGMYHCGACGIPLFFSDTKYESGSGWPSFYDVADHETIELREDLSLGMVRTEVQCKSCKSHLGHLFSDGPKEKTGKRYCINSLALDFRQKT